MMPDPLRAKATVESLRAAMSRTTAAATSLQEGRRLATLRRGKDGELRLAWEESAGHPFLRLRVWTRSDWGLSPTRKALTIRMKELPELIDGLLAAAEELRARLEREGAEE